jgi:peptide/nickel transport system permease protein/peptide/nickel transport system substrate-binding protein
MLLSRRDILTLAGAAALASATGLPAFAQEAAKSGGILRIAAPSNPSSLDPATGGSGFDHSILWTLYDTLVEWDYDTLIPKPGLASWSFPEPARMVLDIREGVTFHDGTPLDAAAVKFNLDRNRQDERSNIKADLAGVTAVEVSGPLQVTLTLTGPDASLPAVLSDRAGMMVSPANIQALGQDTNRKPVGAGPWKFVSWTDNDKVVVTRNDNYWRPGRPYLDGIEFSIIPESATALRAASSGQIEMAYQLPARLKPIIERSDSLQVVAAPTLFCQKLYLNYGREPLNNVKVRQALNFAINREDYIRATMGGLGESAAMLLPKAHWAYDASVAALYPFDPDRSRALLAEAGFGDGLELHIGSYSDQDSVLRSEVIQAQLEAGGFKVRYTRGTLPEITAQFMGNEKRFDALLSLWTGRPDPSMTYALVFGEGSYYNASREADPQLTALLQESRAAQDIAARAAVLGKIQLLVMENALTVPIAFQYELDAIARQAQGYQPNLVGKPKFENMHLAA